MICNQERLLCAECCWISVRIPPPHHTTQTLLHPLSSNSSLWCRTVGSPQIWALDNGTSTQENSPHCPGSPHPLPQRCSLQFDQLSLYRIFHQTKATIIHKLHCILRQRCPAETSTSGVALLPLCQRSHPCLQESFRRPPSTINQSASHPTSKTLVFEEFYQEAPEL